MSQACQEKREGSVYVNFSEIYGKWLDVCIYFIIIKNNQNTKKRDGSVRDYIIKY